MPLFDGSDPNGWIVRAEPYFGFYGLREAEMMYEAVVSMNGDALRWWHWENKRRSIRLWEDLKTIVLRQFGPEWIFE